MQTETHYKIVKSMRMVLFGLFAVNLARILWKTWKYGGSKTTDSIIYDDPSVPEEDDTLTD